MTTPIGPVQSLVAFGASADAHFCGPNASTRYGRDLCPLPAARTTFPSALSLYSDTRTVSNVFQVSQMTDD